MAMKSSVLFTILFQIEMILVVMIKGSFSSGVCANDTAIPCSQNCTALMEMFNHENAISSWNRRHPHIAKAFKHHNVKIAVEIGVARGGLSHYLLTHVPEIEEYYGVDPFLGGYDDSDAMSKILQSVNASVTWSHAVLKTLSSFGCKFRLHYGFSQDAIPAFKENSIDLVFIDGDHTLNGANLDIRLWSPIVKPGGVIMFDDYDGHYPGVIKAVDDFSSKNKLQIHDIKNANVFVVKPPYPLILPDLPGETTTATTNSVAAPPTATTPVVSVATGTAVANAAPGVADLLRENAVLKDKIKELEKIIKHTKNISTTLLHT